MGFDREVFKNIQDFLRQHEHHYYADTIAMFIDNNPKLSFAQKVYREGVFENFSSKLDIITEDMTTYEKLHDLSYVLSNDMFDYYQDWMSEADA